MAAFARILLLIPKPKPAAILSTCLASISYRSSSSSSFRPKFPSTPALGTRHYSSTWDPDRDPMLPTYIWHEAEQRYLIIRPEELPDHDCMYWQICLEPPEDDLSRDEIIDKYVKTLAIVLGSEEEARKKIYSVSTQFIFFFVCNVPQKIARRFMGMPGVDSVSSVPDGWLKRADFKFTGEPFVNGQAVPYDPIYHFAMTEGLRRVFNGVHPGRTAENYIRKPRRRA